MIVGRYGQYIVIMNRLFFSLSLLVILNLNVDAQKLNEYKTGKYYDLGGTVHFGSIYYNGHANQYIKFMTHSQARPIKLKPWKLSSFVIEQDSFIVFKDFYYEGPGGGLTKEIMDFVQVLDTGRFNLYKHYAILSSGPGGAPGPGLSMSLSYSWDLENYLLRQTGNDDIILVRKKNNQRFKEQMVEYFKDFPEIVRRIQTDELEWENMPKIIEIANTKSP